jgi:hypothetical protein
LTRMPTTLFDIFTGFLQDLQKPERYLVIQHGAVKSSPCYSPIRLGGRDPDKDLIGDCVGSRIFLRDVNFALQ